MGMKGGLVKPDGVPASHKNQRQVVSDQKERCVEGILGKSPPAQAGKPVPPSFLYFE
jgi:hypothetical protein